jgi:phospholipase/carboxylesterase
MGVSAASDVDLVVVLHGVAATGADLAPIARAWAKRLPAVRFVTPDAPFPFDEDPARRQWYSLTGVTAENRAARVAAGAAAYDGVVDAAIAAAGTTAARTVVVGYSQAGTMTLDALARGRRFAAVLVISTRFVTPPEGRLDGLVMRVIHGAADAVIPIAEGERVAAVFGAAGATVDFVAIAGGEHAIGFGAAKAGLAFLSEVVAGATA